MSTCAHCEIVRVHIALFFQCRTIRDVGQSVAISDKHFEVVKEFVYLGSLMTPTNDVSLETQRRIQTANRCFFGLRKHLRSSHLSR
jgi:hypothetical protein